MSKTVSVSGMAIGGLFLFLWLFAYPLFTPHEVTLTVEKKLIDPDKEGSHYVVYGTDENIIELERAWYMWGDNIDKVWFQSKEGHTITYQCWGWIVDEWYWYSNCHKILKNIDADGVEL